MPTTPHSAAVHVEDHQVQLSPTLNTALNQLDKSTHALLVKTVTTDDVTLTADEAEQAGYIRVSGAFTAARTLTIPNNNDDGSGPRPKFYTIEHAGSGGFSLTVTTVDGTGVTIAPGNVQRCYCDGVNVSAAGPATGSGGGPYDLVLQRDGLPPDGAIIFRHYPTRSFTLPIAFVGSRFALTVAPTVGAVAFSVRKNGSQIGTINFAIAATTATYSAASATTFTSTDILTIIAPSPQNATASDVAGTLKGSAS